MTKDIIKNQSIVVMDRNYKSIVNSVVRTICYVTGTNKVLYAHELALDHTDKLVIPFLATDDQMDAIQDRIEDLYPGLCIFNPPMYV